jgi:hypothetical protein
MTTTRKLTAAIAYVDTQDPSNTGWAYRLDFECGHQESGELDSETDANGEVVVELEAIIAAHGGVVLGVGVRDGEIHTVDQDGYEWVAADEAE